MRCDECKTDPLTPGHYCDCCGRKLSLQERRALEHAVNPALPRAPEAEHRDRSAAVDRLVGVHFPPAVQAVELGSAPPAPAVGAPGFLDPILEAHFAGLAPADPAPSPVATTVPVVTSVPVAVTEVKPAAPRASSTSDWVQPTVKVLPAGGMELFTDTTPADVAPSHHDGAASFPRCDVCGGHAENGDLCRTCHEKFHALLEPPRAQPVVEAVPSVTDPVTEEEAQSVSALPTAPQAEPAIVDAPPVVTAPVVAQLPACEPVAATAPAPVAPVVPLVLESPADVRVEAPAAVVSAQGIQIKVRPPVASPSAAEPASIDVQATPSRPEVRPAAKASTPVAPRVFSSFGSEPQTASGAWKVAAIVAATVAVVAIGFPLSKMWLGHQEAPAIVHEQPEPAVVPEAAPTPAPVAASERSLPPATDREPVVPATLKTPTANPTAPKPAAAARAAAMKPPVKTVRQPIAPPRPVAATPVSSPAAVALAPEVAPPPAAPEPKPEAPAAPIGPFFELRDVNEVPRVLSRVEPQVPDELRQRQLNEIVIVRVLVTQAGHPMMVNLLRRSKAGAPLDDAIVNAVKKWTFAPAKRRGETVSCWYHIGVPVTQAN